MAVGRYVWVSTDIADLTIKDGPFLWDGIQPITIPDDEQSMQEADALNAGYHYYVAPPGPIDVLNAIIDNIPTVNASYLADANPSVAAVTTQVHELTRVVTALARIQSGMTDDTSGT
jgi:hypothetical protein